MRTLVRLLHFYTNGSIPISSKIFEKLKYSKLVAFMRRTVEKKKDCLSAVKMNRKSKLDILLKFVKVWPALLGPLFYIPGDDSTK